MLLDSMMEDFAIVNRARTADGEGGYSATWTQGKTIRAAVTLDTSAQARIAEAQGVTSVYTVTTARDIVLKYHDVIKRLSDGKIYRITSNGGEKKTPVSASIDMTQVTAEGWKLT